MKTNKTQRKTFQAIIKMQVKSLMNPLYSKWITKKLWTTKKLSTLTDSKIKDVLDASVNFLYYVDSYEIVSEKEATL